MPKGVEHPAIRTAKLGRTYKAPRRSRFRNPDPSSAAAFVALDDVTLEIQPGELFGLLGSNGAGKTTLIKILTTLLAPTTGSAWVDGYEVVTQAQAVRERINMVSGGESSGYGVLTVRENLWLFSQLYGIPSREAQRRIDHMLEVVGLTEQADTRICHLSTGLRQKMNFCRGFVTDPKILFLDEPTLGLDVTSARTIRQFVRAWIRERPGRTLVLTTHYMMEADELCDRLAVLHRGKVLACDTPGNLKRRIQRYPIFELAVTPGVNGWHELGRLPGVHQCTSAAGPMVVDLKVALHDEAVVGAVVQEVLRGGSRILTLKKVEPTLEDVFVELVGHGLRGEEEPA
jgi:ABC-2 type transport system ATP-binding protein